MDRGSEEGLGICERRVIARPEGPAASRGKPRSQGRSNAEINVVTCSEAGAHARGEQKGGATAAGWFSSAGPAPGLARTSTDRDDYASAVVRLVLKTEPFFEAVESLAPRGMGDRSPSARASDSSTSARSLPRARAHPALRHYKTWTALVDGLGAEEVSLGDFICVGGERRPCVIDAVVRLLTGLSAITNRQAPIRTTTGS